jgi:tetraacyldisaccharide-1-P 4'-kinase
MMGLSRKKEIEKRMLIRRTIAAMNKQINKLEEQKKVYVEAGKQAKQKGLTAQYNLALSGLRMTLTQQRRVYEMKLNFEITAQMKDMTQMTSAFLKGMGSLSKDMMKLTKEKDFIKVEKQFNEAMTSIELQAEHLESFMDETQSAFAMGAPGDEETNKELDALITNEASMDGLTTDSEIEKELEILKKKMSQ